MESIKQTICGYYCIFHEGFSPIFSTYSLGRSKCYRRLTQSGDFLIMDKGVTSGAPELEHPWENPCLNRRRHAARCASPDPNLLEITMRRDTHWSYSHGEDGSVPGSWCSPYRPYPIGCRHGCDEPL